MKKLFWIALCAFCFGCTGDSRRMPAQQAHDYSNNGRLKAFDASIHRVFADNVGLVGWEFSTGYSDGFLVGHGCPDGYYVSGEARMIYVQSYADDKWRPWKLEVRSGLKNDFDGSFCLIDQVYFSDH